MNQIFILIAFLLGYKLGRDNRIVPAETIDKIKDIKFFKQKTRVFQDGEIKEVSKEILEDIFNKDLEF